MIPFAMDKMEEIIGTNETLSSQKIMLYDQTANTEKAIEEYEKLIALNPDNTRYYAMLAEYCSKHGLEDKAIEAYHKIVEINPDDPYVHISLADFYKQKGEMEQSFEELKIASEIFEMDVFRSE